NFYGSGNILPYGMEPPEKTTDTQGTGLLTNIIFAFIFAIFLFFLLIKINSEKFIRFWFFVVSVMALGLALNVFLSNLNIAYSSMIALIIALPLAYFEIFKKNIAMVNLNKLLVYPGIAAVFVPILGILGIIILLLLISLYDIWAVWHSGFMQKMANFQINKVGIFGGFFIPYADKKTKQKIKFLKQKYKNKSEKARQDAFKKSKIKVNLAILGGGDIIFPIITAGVFYMVYGIFSALIIVASASLGLLYLSFLTEKKKFYPAMPFLTIAMYLGMIISWLII
ncbi:MAG: presenilin family intramembrane aspartyl protease, partial [Candidatus Pacearchaeota archaeon]